MEKIKFTIHPTFIVFAVTLIFFKKGILLLTYLVVLIIHELTHAFVAKKLGYTIKNIKLSPFGICLNLNSKEIRPKDEIKIALAGPAINLAICLFLVCLWWFVPSSFNHTNIFCYANLITCLFNLIPAFPLDGGRVLLAIFKNIMPLKKAIKFCKIVNIIVSIILFSFFVFTCFFSPNFTYLLVMFCVLSGVFENNSNLVYSIINFSLQKKVGKILKVKTLYVNSSEKIFKICKYIDSFSYLQIFLFNEQTKKVTAKLLESDLLFLVENNFSNYSFKEALNLK